MASIEEKKREHSLSPLNKNPAKVGKLVFISKDSFTEDNNPEDAPSSFSLVPPKTIGTNTSRVGLYHAPEADIVKQNTQELDVFRPVTQFKLQSSVFDLNIRNSFQQDSLKQKIQ